MYMYVENSRFKSDKLNTDIDFKYLSRNWCLTTGFLLVWFKVQFVKFEEKNISKTYEWRQTLHLAVKNKFSRQVTDVQVRLIPQL